MTNTKLDARQVTYRGSLENISSSTTTELDNLLVSIDSKLQRPLQMTADGSATVTLSTSTFANPETDYNTDLPTINGNYINFISGTVTFSATDGGTITVNPGNNVTQPSFGGQPIMRVGLFLDDTGEIQLSFGTPGASLPASGHPDDITRTLPIGWIKLVNNGSGGVSVINPSDVYMYASSGGGGGGGLVTETQSTSFTAEAGKHYLVDSSGGPITVTLPAGEEGLVIRISDESGTANTNNIILDPDGTDTIEGDNTSFILDVNNSWVQLAFTGGDWNVDAPFVGADNSLLSLNGIVAADYPSQTFAVGTAGTDFNISSSGSTHTFNIPDASTSNRGLVTTGAQTIAGAKTFSSAVTVSSATGGILQLRDTTVTSGNGDTIGEIQFFSDDTQAGLVSSIADLQTGANGDFHRLVFRTAGTGGLNQERMTIDGSGNVGIGTASPGTYNVLGGGITAIANTAGGQTLSIISNSANSGDILFADGDTGDARRTGRISYNHATNDLNFFTNGNNLRATIDDAGNVGIGTSSPVSKVEIETHSGSLVDVLTLHNKVNYYGGRGAALAFRLPLDTPYTTSYIGARIGATSEGGSGSGDSFLRFYTTDNQVLQEQGSISNAGAWTLGPSGFTGLHAIEGETLLRTDTTTNANYVLQIRKGATSSTAGANYFVSFGISGTLANSGRIASNGTNAAAFFSTSDRRLKENIAPLSSGLEKILQLNPVSFTWKEQQLSEVGFIAQEVQTVLPHVVSNTDDGLGEEVPEGTEPWQMTDGGPKGFLPYMVKAIQELHALVQAQQEEINTLKGGN